MVETLLKLLCKCNYNFKRILWELEKITLDLIWKNQHAKATKILENKKSGLININIHYRQIVIKMAWHGTKTNKEITETKESGTNQGMYRSPNYNKGAASFQCKYR